MVKRGKPELHYAITDMAGNVKELCDPQGQVQWRSEQGVWQELYQWRLERSPKPYLEEAILDPLHCDLRHQGQIVDEETGLYYNCHRYYDPQICQYLSPDPIGLAGGTRPQAYVHNPLEWGDPLGLSSCELAKNMEKKGIARPKDSAAHHIVAETAKKAEPTRKILKKHKIDINSPENGVFLPNSKNTDSLPGILHNGRHPDEYLDAVNNRLINADKLKGKQGVLDALSEIRHILLTANRNANWKSVLI